MQVKRRILSSFWLAESSFSLAPPLRWRLCFSWQIVIKAPPPTFHYFLPYDGNAPSPTHPLPFLAMPRFRKRLFLKLLSYGAFKLSSLCGPCLNQESGDNIQVKVTSVAQASQSSTCRDSLPGCPHRPCRTCPSAWTRPMYEPDRTLSPIPGSLCHNRASWQWWYSFSNLQQFYGLRFSPTRHRCILSTPPIVTDRVAVEVDVPLRHSPVQVLRSQVSPQAYLSCDNDLKTVLKHALRDDIHF